MPPEAKEKSPAAPADVTDEPLAADLLPEKADSARRTDSGPLSGGSKGGFFTLYKPGQGYWTRMGTGVGAAFLALLTAWQIYLYLPTITPWRSKQLALGVAAGFFVVVSLVVWWLTNKPSNADFLIATDGEMKKVNWTSRRELIGSTKVVIFFMLLIAVFLFLADQLFWILFYLLGVLKVSPFSQGGGT